MKNKIFTLLVLSTLAIASQAQNVADAVRYSAYDPMGTARTVGVGSAFGAMGADFSVQSINPAGMAEFRIGEFSITPSISSSNTNAYFVSDKANTKRSNSAFTLDNIGFAIANRPRSSKWSTSNWSVGFSKLADFNRSVSLSGENLGSITERFVERANGKSIEDLDGFEAGLAYEAGVIFQDANGNYQSDFLPDDIVKKSQVIDTKGGINELSVSWAGNYDERINVGLALAVPFVNYEENKTYKESVVAGNFSNNLEYIESLNTSGAGFNFKMGLQYKVQRQVRLGVALHSPTWYVLTDDYNSQINYKFSSSDQNFTGQGSSPDGSFKYNQTTPWKVIGSIGTILDLGKIKGFVNADVEFMDYTNNEFDFTNYSNDPSEVSYTQEVNQAIDNVLGSATNYRLGAELAYDKFRVRGGYTLSTSPYIDDTDKYSSWSTGIGFREEKFFLDFAYRRRSTQEGYNPYIVLDQEGRDPLANIDANYGRIVATLGFKF